MRPVYRWFFWETATTRMIDIFSSTIVVNDLEKIRSEIKRFSGDFSEGFGVPVEENWCIGYTYRVLENFKVSQSETIWFHLWIERGVDGGSLLQAEEIFPRLYRPSAHDSRAEHEAPNGGPSHSEICESTDDEQEYVVPNKIATS